jgi:hypothetical protein
MLDRKEKGETYEQGRKNKSKLSRLRIRILINFGTWILIRIRVKSWIRNRIREALEPWRAVDAHNGGLAAQNVALEGL